MKRPSTILLGARTWLLCFAAATALGTTLAWQRWSGWRSQGKPLFWSAEYIQPQLIPWYSWAVIAPLLMFTLHRVASLEITKWRRIAAFVALAVVAISLQAVVQGFALGWWWSFPNLMPVDPAWHIVDQVKSRSVMSVLVVWVIGAMYHATMAARMGKADPSLSIATTTPACGSTNAVASTIAPIALRGADRVWFVASAEIEWVEADGDHVIVHTAKAKHRIRETISALEQRLPPDQLLRVSRSAIVNIAAIREMQRWFRGNYVVILRDGTKVTTGARYRGSRSVSRPIYVRLTTASLGVLRCFVQESRASTASWGTETRVRSAMRHTTNRRTTFPSIVPQTMGALPVTMAALGL